MKTTDPIPTTATQNDIIDKQPERRGFGRRGFLSLLGGLGAGALVGCEKNVGATPAPSEGNTPVDNGDQDTENTGTDTTEPTNAENGGNKELNKADLVDELLETSAETPEPLDGEKYGSLTGGPDGWEITETNGGVQKYAEAAIGQLNDWMNSAALPDGWEPDDEPADQPPPLTENNDRAVEAIFGTKKSRDFNNSHVIYEQTEAMITGLRSLHNIIAAYRFSSLQQGIEQFQITFGLDNFEEVGDLMIVKGGTFQLDIKSNNPEFLDALKETSREMCGIDLDQAFAIGGVVRDLDTDGSGKSPKTAYTSMLMSADEIDKIRYPSS